MSRADRAARPGIFRWRGVATLVVFLGLFVLGYWLLLDRVVERGVEKSGEELVGARVDLDRATVRLFEGQVRLAGLAVADPDAPMKNLFEAAEIIAKINPVPLFDKKVVIDTLAIRGVAFGTARKTSGALPNSDRTMGGMVARQVKEYLDGIRIPPLNLKGLASSVVNVSAISGDSLRTIAMAQGLAARVDSARKAWGEGLQALNPKPKVDSARATAERLRNLDVKTMGLPGARQAIEAAKQTLTSLSQTDDQIKTFQLQVDTGVDGLKSAIAGLDSAKRADMAYARGLVNLPSLDGPDISPAIFGQVALQRIKPILEWVQLAERYLPPGLDPRSRLGPKRARRSGLTVDFPVAQQFPKFLMRFGEAHLEIGGAGAAAGRYLARIAGVTTEPALYGKPMQFVAGRSGGAVGPSAMRVGGMLDHTRQPVHDSVAASFGGLTLPALDIGPLGARLLMGQGDAELAFERKGNTIAGRWRVRSERATWEKIASAAGSGTASALEDLVWRTVSGVRQIDLAVGIQGSLDRPRLSIESNIGDEIARSLKQQLGAEVEKAEHLVRQRVDSLVQGPMQAARDRLGSVQEEIQQRVVTERAEVDRAKSELEARIKEATRKVAGGLIPQIR